MQHGNGKGEKVEKAERANFVSASIGTGVYTGNYGEMHPFRNRLSFIGEVGYGHWLNGVSGVTPASPTPPYSVPTPRATRTSQRSAPDI